MWSGKSQLPCSPQPRGWTHNQPLLAPSIYIFTCNSVKSGELTPISKHNPFKFHSCNRMESLVWWGHETGSLDWLTWDLGPSVQDWNPHTSFTLKGSQISTLQSKRWFKSKNIEMKYMNYVIYVSSTMWRIKNQPSNSISCGDNALLRLLLLVAGSLYQELQVTSSFCNLELRFEGLFCERCNILKGRIACEGH